MSKKEEEYLTLKDIESEMADFITIKLESGKSIIMKRISKEDESKIRRKHTKTTYDQKTRQSRQQLDNDKYGDEIIHLAFVKPKLTVTQIKNMSLTLYNEVFSKYAQETGLIALTQNLEDLLRVI